MCETCDALNRKLGKVGLRVSAHPSPAAFQVGTSIACDLCVAEYEAENADVSVLMWQRLCVVVGPDGRLQVGCMRHKMALVTIERAA